MHTSCYCGLKLTLCYCFTLKLSMLKIGFECSEIKWWGVEMDGWKYMGVMNCKQQSKET